MRQRGMSTHLCSLYGSQVPREGCDFASSCHCSRLEAKRSRLMKRDVSEKRVSEQEVYVNRDSNQPPFPLYESLGRESQSIHAYTESL